MTAPPRELLAELVSALRTGKMPPASARAWFADAVRSWERGLPLEQSLGLSGPKARLARDEALRAAASILAPDAKPRPAARILAKHIRHFETRILPRCKQQPDRPLAGWKRELYRAFLAGRVVPTDEKHLAGILEEKTPTPSD